MKIYCNGFNLYRKFETSEPLIRKFKYMEWKNICDLEVSLTFAIFKTKNNELLLTGGNSNGVQKIVYDFGSITSISCTNDSIFVLNADGKFFRIDIVNLEKVIQVETEKFLQPDDKFVLVAIGDKIKTGLTRFGYIYDFPNKLSFDVHSTVEIKAGGVHCLLLDSQGNVYSYGSGSRGQLGHGDLEDYPNPTQIEALAGIRITAISCGTWHCAVISKDGDLYTWGWNQNGQLGLPVNNTETKEGVSVMASPHVIDFPDSNANAVKVACGKRHTIVLLDNGELYGCGMNKYKQLKEDDQDVIETMNLLGEFSKERVKDIKCGPWNSVVCCE